jgi:hypothetical protein
MLRVHVNVVQDVQISEFLFYVEMNSDQVINADKVMPPLVVVSPAGNTTGIYTLDVFLH